MSWVWEAYTAKEAEATIHVYLAFLVSVGTQLRGHLFGFHQLVCNVLVAMVEGDRLVMHQL